VEAIEALQSAMRPIDRDGLKALLSRMLEPDEQFRRWTLARFSASCSRVAFSVARRIASSMTAAGIAHQRSSGRGSVASR
jgi:hypothetical protein